MKKIIFCYCCFIILPCFSQNEYDSLIDKATKFYIANDFRQAGLHFSKAFTIKGMKSAPINRYNAACAWSLAKIPDSAFCQLSLIATLEFKQLKMMLSDSDLVNLHQDLRWMPLVERIRKNKEKTETHLNKKIVAILDTVMYDDQHYRIQIEAIEKKFGASSKEVKAYWEIIKNIDSLNLIKVTQILDKHGWLGEDSIGREGNVTLFLVIQHSDLKTQEKYLPIARAATKIGNMSSSSLALLEDRVALGQGRKQIYGSQIAQNPITKIYYVSPLEDPDRVDQRRAKAGLEPLATYVLNWDLKWDLEQYKKDLPIYEKTLKKK